MKQGYNPGQRPLLLSIYLKRTIVNPLTECHLWTGPRSKRGYVSMSRHSKRVEAHKIFYEYFVKKVDAGKELHHRCENGHLGCVNPFHLREVTRSVHMHLRHEYRKKKGK